MTQISNYLFWIYREPDIICWPSAGASLGERTKVDPDGSSCNSTSFRRAEPAATEVLPFDTEVDSTRDEDDIEEARRARTDVAEAAPQPVSEV